MAYDIELFKNCLKDRSLINDSLDVELKIALIDFDATLLKLFSDYDSDFVDQVLENDLSAFKYIKREILTPLFLDKWITRSPQLIKHVYEPSKDLMIKAYNADKNVIQYLKKPPYEIYLAAVKVNGVYLKFVPAVHHTIELVKAAMAENIESYRYSAVKNFEFDAYVLFLDESRIDLLSEYHKELIPIIMKYDPKAAAKYLNDTEVFLEEDLFEFIALHPEYVTGLNNPSLDILKIAAASNFEILDHFKEDIDLIKSMILIDGRSIKFLPKKTLKNMIDAVTTTREAIQFIENPREFLIALASN